MKLRNSTPNRSKSVESYSEYSKYRKQLEEDFSHHCGYCGDLDCPRKANFEIDHFVPKKIMNKVKDNDYYNLVYSCKSCNNAKSAKWPTGDEKIHNDGHQGWIDPCDPMYDEQFERDNKGNIIYKTILGKWMYDNLKLYKSQHRLIWSYEQTEIVTNELKEYINGTSSKELLLLYAKLIDLKDQIFKKFYSNNE